MNAQWDRNPQGQDRETGLGAKHDGPVAEGHAPKTGRELPLETVERVEWALVSEIARQTDHKWPVPVGRTVSLIDAEIDTHQLARAAIASMGDDGTKARETK